MSSAPNTYRPTPPRIIGVIQARMGSTRLPGKVLLPLAGRTSVQWIVERMRAIQTIQDIVLATADTAENDPLAQHGATQGVVVVRGSETDLIDRMLRAASASRADALLIVTADCPLVDPEMMSSLTKRYRADPLEFDYLTNAFPLTVPDGLDLHLIPIRTLDRLNRELSDPFEREWFISYLREHPERFRIYNESSTVAFPTDLRLTMDYPEDYRFLSALLDGLHAQGPQVPFDGILRYVEAHPDLKVLNANRVDLVIKRGIKGNVYHELRAKQRNQNA